MRAVWKFPFPAGADGHRVMTPAGSVPRAFAFQGRTPAVWIEVDPEQQDRETWSLVLIGTGAQLPDDGDWRYVGTAIVADGEFVFHGYARPDGLVP